MTMQQQFASICHTQRTHTVLCPRPYHTTQLYVSQVSRCNNHHDTTSLKHTTGAPPNNLSTRAGPPESKAKSNFKITPPKENVEIEASPFKTIIRPDETKKYINRIHSQLNFTNQIFSTVSKQLERIDEAIPHIADIPSAKLDPTRPIYYYDIPSKDKLQ
ncbi:hypothetical protein RYX36_008824, partial [Vicia faba]